MNGEKKIWEKLKDWHSTWTAQGINDFQKTLFPIFFLLFTTWFTLHTYNRVGDIETNNIDDVRPLFGIIKDCAQL